LFDLWEYPSVFVNGLLKSRCLALVDLNIVPSLLELFNLLPKMLVLFLEILGCLQFELVFVNGISLLREIVSFELDFIKLIA